MSKRLALFVHGLLGNPKGTWKNFPTLIASDPDLAHVYDVAHFQYETGLFRGHHPRRIAGHLHTEIELKYAQYKDIVILAHSQGGLIARQYLVDRIAAEQGLRVSRLVTFATPHLGSTLASWASKIPWAGEQIRTLGTGSDYIRELRKEWGEARRKRLVRTLYLVAAKDRLVQQISAEGSEWDDESCDIPQAYHTDLVKPVAAASFSYIAAKEFMLQHSPQIEQALRTDARNFLSFVMPVPPLKEELANELIDNYIRKSFYTDYDCSIHMIKDRCTKSDTYILRLEQSFGVHLSIDGSFTVAVAKSYAAYDLLVELDQPYEMIFIPSGQFDASTDIIVLCRTIQNNYVKLQPQLIASTVMEKQFQDLGVHIRNTALLGELSFFRCALPASAAKDVLGNKAISYFRVDLFSRGQSLRQGSFSWIADCATHLKTVSIHYGSLLPHITGIRFNCFLPSRAGIVNQIEDRAASVGTRTIELRRWIQRGHGVTMLWKSREEGP